MEAEFSKSKLFRKFWFDIKTSGCCIVHTEAQFSLISIVGY